MSIRDFPRATRPRIRALAALFTIAASLAFVTLYLAGVLQSQPASAHAADRMSDAPTPTPTPPTQLPTEIDDDGSVLVNTDLVTLNVTVMDNYNRYVTGLGKEAFTIIDNNQPQEISFFSSEDTPASIAVLFDVSGSMSGEKVARARDALSHFVQTSHERDEYFLIGFSSRAHLLLDRTRDSDALLNKMTLVDTRGNTALYDAVYLGVEKLRRASHPKRAVLLISDGQDNNSRYTFSELRRLLKESDTLIYSVGIDSGAANEDAARGSSILDELSSVTGGKAFFPQTTAALNDVFERIALELRYQYSIGYRPADFTPDGKWRKVKVKVKPPRGLPRLTVRSRDGYYATTLAAPARR